MPLLTIAGIDDTVTPSDLPFIAGHVPGGCGVEVPGAHLCTIESAAASKAALLGPAASRRRRWFT
jgi:3-oxoadipate enol-lactonase